MKRLISILSLVGLVSSCTHSDTGADFSLEATKSYYEKNEVVDLVVSEPKYGLAYYKPDGKYKSVEWSKCQIKDSKSFVVVFNQDGKKIDAKEFCKSWVAQTFLGKNISVLGINLPGFGRSAGDVDYNGRLAVKASKAAIAKSKIDDDASFDGVWGYGESTIPAAYLARASGIKWAILGGGLYDAEVVLNDSQDESVKSWLTGLVSKHGEDVLESHSIAWDIDGLPNRVILYHGEKDVAYPMSQVGSFKESLSSEGNKATLQVLPGVGHKLDNSHHRRILGMLIDQL